MSWPMQSQGQWPSAVAMTPDMMNMGSYTPDQWAALQQNWQQWAQWQQQYAQWQNQYGEKYAAQMQVMQPGARAGVPAPPPSAPPPAPPPPEQPPPPPPDQNNQPLYAQPAAPPAAPPGNAPWPEEPPPADTDALRKLAEEEKLFDIQFQKWEEEIDKWRRENVNHPDREAYKEYEAKFEACRAQLMERRQQMKQKRARLTSSAPASGNKPPVVPPPKPATDTYANQSQGYRNNDYYNQTQSYNKRDQSYTNPKPYTNNKAFQEFNEPPPSHMYSRANRGNIDPQDRYESYGDINNYMDDNPTDNSSFLPASGAPKNIPGLDLVPEVDKSSQSVDKPQDVIDITDDKGKGPQAPKGPDYTTISKGINHILGDAKIMNILSSLQGGQNLSDGGNTAQNNSYNNFNNQNVAPNNFNNQNMAPNNFNNQNVAPNNQWNRNDNNNYNNQQYGNRQNNTPYNNRQDQNYDMHQNHPNQHNHPGPQNSQFQQNNMKHQNNSMQQSHQMQHNQDMTRYPPPNQRRMYDNGQEDAGQDEYFDRNQQYGGPPRNEQAQRPNQPAPRPLLEVPVPPPTMNAFQRGPPNRGMAQNAPSNPPPPPPRPKWMDEPLFTPSIIVEYEHKPLRLKARDFIEPVHTFDYQHKSKDGEKNRKDFEKEADEMFSRKPRRDRENEYPADRFDDDRHLYNRDYERRGLRDDNRDDFRGRPLREEFGERRRPDDRYDDRRRDDRDKYTRRDDGFRDRERERDRDNHRDRYSRRDDNRHRSRSRDRDSRKREHSKESEPAVKKPKENDVFDHPKHIVMIDDILEPPGREMRPEKIVIILRGPPGSGKSYLAKLIRDREAEHGGTVRIMSIDDYFMQEGEIEEEDPTTGKIVKKPTLKYEYDEDQEETYLNSLKRAFKRSITDGYFQFLIYDAVNAHVKCYADIWNFARQNGFQVYVCTMELDPITCHRRNVHNRSLSDVQVIAARFCDTPPNHIRLEPAALLQSAAIPTVTMEDAEDLPQDTNETEVESIFTSKWERMDDATQLAKLDGTNKPLRPSQLSMEDYLQLDDWTPGKAKPGKKSVRWADIEERRQQEKMRAIGFVVGQTDWNRMTDPTMGSSALTQTKYIERVRRT